MLIGALAWFRPYLTSKQTFVAGVAAPPPLEVPGQVALAPGERGCMSSISVEPDSRRAQFEVLGPASKHGGPPVELVLSASGYRSVGELAGGYPPGPVTVSVTPPPRALIAQVCFVDRGRQALSLAASGEARTLTRSATTVGGVPVVADISLTFYEGRPSSLLERLGTVFGRASNLTDHLIPVWLIWIVAVLTAFGVPFGIAAALYLAMRADEAAARV
ncbi:MAG TPA: hypothetical protein VKV16_00965 [Solirubrobacteraceae bacterium]|nr:hypothetical protein [Solirubrobacteraceae bacterium]